MSSQNRNKFCRNKAFQKENSAEVKTRYKDEINHQEFLLEALAVIGGTSEAVDIADCGFTAKATYYCPEHAKKNGCTPNSTSGGWVPAVTLRKKQYAKCKAIKENTVAPHFNDGFDNSYR